MKLIRCALAVLVGLAAAPPAKQTPDTPAWRLLRASEADQIAAVNSVLDAGFPPGPSSDLTMLMFEKRAIVLPLLERKIEQVLASPSPSDYFTDKAVDPQKFVDRVAWVIATTGDAEALTEVSKLVKLDAKRFGRLVDITLNTSMDYSKSHNPFVVAYSGLSLGDPVVDGLILAWTEKYLSIDPEERARAEAAARGLGPPPPPLAEKMKQLWVDAMLERSGGVPTEAQWATDPIASGLSRPLAVSVHSEIPELIGSVQALVEISKIFQLDGHWSNYGSNYPPPGENPFGVAYIGLAIGNPTTQHLILEWAEKHLTVVAETMKHVWADAVLTRYGGAPTDAQWASDPIASGLSRLLAQSLHREMSQLINEALQARASK